MPVSTLILLKFCFPHVKQVRFAGIIFAMAIASWNILLFCRFALLLLNDEGGTQLCKQEFEEHYLDDVVNNVIYPVTGGNRYIARALREQMIKAGFEQPH